MGNGSRDPLYTRKRNSEEALDSFMIKTHSTHRDTLISHHLDHHVHVHDDEG